VSDAAVLVELVPLVASMILGVALVVWREGRR